MKVAADIMTTDVVKIDSFATLLEASQLMKQHNVKTLIVDRTSVEDAYGIITQTDIARAVANAEDPAQTYVCQVMTKPCIVVNPNLSIEHVLKLFVNAKIRSAPVIQDKLLGIISLTDIVTKGDYSTPDKMKYLSTMALPELPGDRASEGQWEVADWEGELENWCSG